MLPMLAMLQRTAPAIAKVSLEELHEPCHK